MSNMTTGQIIGTIAGAVIGYFTGGAGWYLAGSILLGASAGYAAGTALDPVAPDVPSAGQSSMGLDMTMADEGIVIADALGTVKGNGNIFWYGGARVVEIKEKVKGGKGGGSKKVKTGEKYYLSWAMGLCEGPVDTLISIFKNDNPVWQGTERRIDSSYGRTTIVLEDFGTIYFYFGTSDQLPNSFMETLISEEIEQTFNPPYKNLCWVYFKDCDLGSYNRVPTFKFVFKKWPQFDFSILNGIGGYDYNPAHAIYYILTNAAEIDSSLIDETSFSSVAESLTLEGRGISLYFGEERNAITYLESILTHINAILSYENDGKFHLMLIRPDVEEVDMLSFSDEDFVEPPIIKRNTWVETNNEVKVQYAKRVDVEFGDPVDPVQNPDVYVMGFIDESFTTICSEDWSDYETNWYSRGYCLCTGLNYQNVLTCGTPCAKFVYDLEQFYESDEITPKTKTWLLEGSYHITNINRMYSTQWDCWTPILPNGYTVSVYADIYEDGLLSLWSADLALWQYRFQQMIQAGRGEFIPGSILRVYIDTSSLGGIAALEPAYSQFKTWVTGNYGGLVYLEYDISHEWWIEALHEDLTPWGYGRG